MATFPKTLRLIQAADFRRLFRSGKKLNTQYFALYNSSNQLTYPRIGLTITKKAARSAVKRNQIKRIARESFRLNQAKLMDLDIMIVSYKDIDTLSKAELRLQLEQAWLKLISRYEKR